MIAAGKLAMVALGWCGLTGAQAGAGRDPDRPAPRRPSGLVHRSQRAGGDAGPPGASAQTPLPRLRGPRAASARRNRRLLRPGSRHRPQRRPPPPPWRPPARATPARQHLGRPHRHPSCRRWAARRQRTAHRSRSGASRTPSPARRPPPPPQVPAPNPEPRRHRRGLRRRKPPEQATSRRRAGDAPPPVRPTAAARRRPPPPAATPAPRLSPAAPRACPPHARRRPQSSGRAPSRDQTAPRPAFPCSRPSSNRPFPARRRQRRAAAVAGRRPDARPGDVHAAHRLVVRRGRHLIDYAPGARLSTTTIGSTTTRFRSATGSAGRLGEIGWPRSEADGRPSRTAPPGRAIARTDRRSRPPRPPSIHRRQPLVNHS